VADPIRHGQIEGECAGATHVVTGITVGAFLFASGASGGASGGAQVMGTGMGAGSSSETKKISEDGNQADCAGAAAGATAPPSGCAAPIRIELSSLGANVRCPPSLEWQSGTCVPTVKCPTGTIAHDGGCVEIGSMPKLSAACESSSASACGTECEAGNAEACAEMGHRLALGKNGLEKDIERSHALSRKACDLGSARGCSNLAASYYEGLSGRQDRVEALKLWASACDGGFSLACYMRARFIDGDEGKNAQQRACDAGVGPACVEWGLRSTVPEEKLNGFRRACQLGSPWGCGYAAGMHSGQAGLPKNDEAALDFLNAGCDRGNLISCNDLAVRFEVAGRLERAAELFDGICNAGSATGCSNLGIIYHEGKGVPKDPQRALQLMRRACTAGEERACAVANAGAFR